MPHGLGLHHGKARLKRRLLGVQDQQGADLPQSERGALFLFKREAVEQDLAGAARPNHQPPHRVPPRAVTSRRAIA